MQGGQSDQCLIIYNQHRWQNNKNSLFTLKGWRLENCHVKKPIVGYEGVSLWEFGLQAFLIGLQGSGMLEKGSKHCTILQIAGPVYAWGTTHAWWYNVSQLCNCFLFTEELPLSLKILHPSTKPLTKSTKLPTVHIPWLKIAFRVLYHCKRDQLWKCAIDVKQISKNNFNACI